MENVPFKQKADINV